jgi:CHAT domain-containing protein
VQTLRKIDLIAFIEAEDKAEGKAEDKTEDKTENKLWRLTANHGKFRIEDLGPVARFHDAIERFISAPTDPGPASELGERLLPEDVVRRTDEPLYVVLDAPLAAMPIVALRRNGQPLIATRPVLRTPRLPVVGSCELRPDVARARVLADAAGDLPEARRESNEVASLFQTTPFVGPAATSTALFAAKSDPLLHVAVHAEIDAGGGVLKLHDRAVSAAEISANKLGPRLVVLSACSTARSWDPEMAGSLSTGFLAGGASQVIATLRPVSDTGALDLTRKFYSAHGANDPVRALAAIQASLVDSDNKEWPSFAVFGKEVCLRR